MNRIISLFRRLALWVVCDSPIPLGNLAPRLFDFGMGQKGKKSNPRYNIV